jgi:hypothetical protein
LLEASMDVLDWVKKRVEDPAAPQDGAAAKSDLPADLSRARPITVLLELGARLDAAASAGPDPKARSAALAAIQDEATGPISALLAQYLANAAGTPAAREAAWKSFTGFQMRLTQALCMSAGAELTAAGAVRALSACRLLAKLHLVHQAAVPGRVWHVAYALHAAAEKAGFAAAPVHAHSDHRTMTTVEHELLRLLMLHVSAPDKLAPQEIELADRTVERLGAEFTLRQPGVADNPFCFEPGGESGPRRAKDAQPAASARYFGPGMAYESLQRFGKDLTPGAHLNTVQHLLAAWRGESAEQAATHEPATGTLRVLHGYAEVWSELSRTRNGGELSLAATSPNVPRPAETWNLRGVSASELAAEVPQESRPRVKVGGLVGVLREGSEHWVGMIRRLHARPEGRVHADIAVLSRAPEARTLRQVFRKGEDRPYTEAASKQFGMSSMRVLILAAEPGQPANLLLPPERWAPGRVFELEKDSELHYLRGLQVVRRGDDYVLATFDWLPAPD